MVPILMSVAEPAFIPWSPDSEAEAQEVVRQLLQVLRRTVEEAPVWEQYEFSRRAENILKRNRITTYIDLVKAIYRGNIPGGGKLVMRECTEALFTRKWGGHHEK